MIHVAICDDDKALTKNLAQLLRDIAAGQGIDVDCELFFDGSRLIRAITEQQMCFDLIYLDIDTGRNYSVQTLSASFPSR